MFDDQATLLPGYYQPDRRIWLIGGSGATGTSGTANIWYYQINTDTFYDHGSLPFGVDNMNAQSSTYFNEFIYFVHANNLYKFNMADQTTTLVSALLIGNVNAPCLVNDGQYIYVMGGEDENDSGDARSTFQVFDTLTETTTNTWFQGDNLAQRRMRCACNISPDGNFIYLFGGSYDPGILYPQTLRDTAEKIDISSIANLQSQTATWSVVSGFTMSGNEYFSRVVTDKINGFMYIVGGRESIGGTADTNIQIFDPSTETSSISSATLKVARSSPAVLLLGQQIVVFGGSGNNEENTWEFSNVLTYAPTPQPTNMPTGSPTNPTVAPTNPTMAPTNPTIAPTNPTTEPTPAPTNPTIAPTNPTIAPTDPSTQPTESPTPMPSESPTRTPTGSPTFPTVQPTSDPTGDPTTDPTNDPTSDPTMDPTNDPTTDPTDDPTKDPTTDPTNDPTTNPTSDPTNDPTTDPTNDPTADPTTDPTNDPTLEPTLQPTYNPTVEPTKTPTLAVGPGNPSRAPTLAPVDSDDSFETTSDSNGDEESKDEEKKKGVGAIFDPSGDGFWFMIVAVCLFVVVCCILMGCLLCYRKNQKLKARVQKLQTSHSNNAIQRVKSVSRSSLNPLKSSPSQSNGEVTDLTAANPPPPPITPMTPPMSSADFHLNMTPMGITPMGPPAHQSSIPPSMIPMVGVRSTSSNVNGINGSIFNRPLSVASMSSHQRNEPPPPPPHALLAPRAGTEYEGLDAMNDTGILPREESDDDDDDDMNGFYNRGNAHDEQKDDELIPSAHVTDMGGGYQDEDDDDEGTDDNEYEEDEEDDDDDDLWSPSNNPKTPSAANEATSNGNFPPAPPPEAFLAIANTDE